MTAPDRNSRWPPAAADRRPPRLERVGFAALAGFEEDDHLAAWAAFARSCRAMAHKAAILRPALPPSRALVALAVRLEQEAPSRQSEARALFERHFEPFAILPASGEEAPAAGFLTGYYEPLVEGSLVASAEFQAPVLARPDDLVSFPPGAPPLPERPEIGAARRRPDHGLEPYPDRAAIEAGAIDGHTRPIVFLRDAVEVFLAQVQGSAKVRLADGRWLRLVYAGRNGQPYRSIGRILVEEGYVDAANMSLATLEGWIRAHGQGPGEAGRALMQRNPSYVFFEARECADLEEGPVGGAGFPLSPLRSIAIDREIWPYGVVFWIDAEIPWRSDRAQPFRRLQVAQDTGSAILGPARADLYFGSGEGAGRRAASIRHEARMHVLLPKKFGARP